MSAAGGLLSQVVGGLGGAQTAVMLVVGGLVVGAATGGAVSSGVFSGGSATSDAELSVYPCPDTGPALFTVPGGQKFLVTGKTDDGSWLRIHNPLPGRTEAWVQANPLTVNGSLADIPVAECAPEVAAQAWVGPAPSLTAILNNSRCPSPTPVPSATPVPNARPSLTGLTTSTGKISYDTGSYCPTAVKKVTFKVKASDTSGIEGVSLFWREPGAATYAQSSMSRTAGTAKSGTWQVTLDTTANGITKAGKLAFYAVATDTAGATRRIPTKGADNITVAVCVNTGPTIKSAASSVDPLFWDPLGVGKCKTATSISAAVSDVDGLASVTLFFRRPGDAAWSSKPMTLRSGKWSATLATSPKENWIPDPPTGNLRWYIKAVDKTGLDSQTKTASITVRRCDSEATFFDNSVAPSCSPDLQQQLSWTFSITDPDGPIVNKSRIVGSATLSYRIVNDSTGATFSQKKTVTVASQRFSIAGTALDGNSFNGRNSVTWTITTTDRYGGKSSEDRKDTVTLSGCLF